MAITEQSDL